MSKHNYEVEFEVKIKDSIIVAAYNYDDATLKAIKQIKKMYESCKDIRIGTANLKS